MVTQAALETACDVLVIAGDLFDNNRVDDALIAGSVRVLRESGVTTFIAPGNHDAYDETSVYHRFTPSERVFVASDPSGEWLDLLDGRLSLWGRPIVVHEPAYRPFGIPVVRPYPAGEAWHVAVAHGHFVDGSVSESTPRSSPISSADLASVDADYVALGHWDIPAQVGDHRLPRWYSGAPMMAGEPRTAILATLDPEVGVQVAMLPLRSTGRDCVTTNESG
jgi:DNA repair exonuclease SbcCD nuclease subunit